MEDVFFYFVDGKIEEETMEGGMYVSSIVDIKLLLGVLVIKRLVFLWFVRKIGNNRDRGTLGIGLFLILSVILGVVIGCVGV